MSSRSRSTPISSSWRSMAARQGILPKARIDEKAPRPCQKVAVEIFQWVSNQWNIQPPKVFADPLRHGCSPSSRF